MTRGGKAKKRDISARRCIATGETQPKHGLIRFVVGPEQQVIPDLAEKLPGRGIWVSADYLALERAIERKLFSRSARKQAFCDMSLIDVTHNLLKQRLIDALALSRKAGVALNGFEKVKAQLKSGQTAILIEAKDGALDGKAKLSSIARAIDPRIYTLSSLTASELGLAFGRGSVVHAGLEPSGITKSIRREAERFEGLHRL